MLYSLSAVFPSLSVLQYILHPDRGLITWWEYHRLQRSAGKYISEWLHTSQKFMMPMIYCLWWISHCCWEFKLVQLLLVMRHRRQTQGHSNVCEAQIWKAAFPKYTENDEFRRKKSSLLFSCFYIPFWFCLKALYVAKKVEELRPKPEVVLQLSSHFYMANYLSV